MLYQSIELAGELDGNLILLPSFSCQRLESALVRHRRNWAEMQKDVDHLSFCVRSFCRLVNPLASRTKELVKKLAIGTKVL